jgi:hypothetical protein
MKTPTVGRVVLVGVDRRNNDGQHYAPGIITRVNADGTVDVRAFPLLADQRLTTVPLYDSETAAAADLAEHIKALPDGLDAHDVYRWTPIAWWPSIVEPTAPAPAAPEPAAAGPTG